jgi:molybdopterin-containing oxidoreductase family iron-sulfur binding subunit
VALAVNTINQVVGNVGHTVLPLQPLTGFEPVAGHAELRVLVDRMTAGAVPVLMLRGANPAYATPRALGFAAAMGKVPFKVSFSSYPDETTELCDLVLPDHHPLESWGDATPLETTYGLVQPAMDPVFNTRQTADVLITLAKEDPALAAHYPWPEYRSLLIERLPGGGGATAFTNALTRGLVDVVSAPAPAAAHGAKGSVPAAAPAAAAVAAAPKVGGPIDATPGDFTLVVYPSPALGDGRGANKPWLQELPDPVSKIVWQSWVEIHPEAAARMGVESGDVLRIETPAGSIVAPAWVFMGVRADTVAVALGRGHTAYGRYANGVGVNALDVLPIAEDRAGDLALVSTRAKVTKTGDFLPLVTTEGSARQHGRGVAQAVTAADLQKGHGTDKREGEEIPGDASHAFKPGLRAPVANDAQGAYGDPQSNDRGMYEPGHWSGMANRRWAMTVDLARCTGCSACITACYAENNIPTVGAPWQVGTIMPPDKGFGANILRGREMTWIRLERYFEGAEHADGKFDPAFETRFIPMLCQHCGNAPCEPVCPVYATYHSPDGLNVQVYNRCVGTRYCSNNCPYKVRYFNWFGYGEPNRPQYAFPEPLNWQLNPDVTVRGKGVMEKCTFCVQRIREAEHRARLERRGVAADEFTVACAQGCPSRAITFGDAADSTWSVTKLVQDRRAYHVFEELNTFTGVVYLKKVTHPAPSGAERT